jgi:hypothetical protein
VPLRLWSGQVTDRAPVVSGRGGRVCVGERPLIAWANLVVGRFHCATTRFDLIELLAAQHRAAGRPIPPSPKTVGKRSNIVRRPHLLVSAIDSEDPLTAAAVGY